MVNNKITLFGNGYVSRFLTYKLNKLGWDIVCTSRKIGLETPVKDKNITIINFFDPNLISMIKSSNIILSTVPPDNAGKDPVLKRYGDIISKGQFQWLGYLSSTSVYGNHDGAWVDEETECFPSSEQSRKRLSAERGWLDMYVKFNLPAHILRLSGIYGPGRNCLEDIRAGKDFTILKESQYFSRIHVEDICHAILGSISLPTPGEVYNVSDNEPAPIHNVHQFGAKILGKSRLKEIFVEEASLSEQAKMFFADNKKVSNKKIVQTLSIRWHYPHYRLGLLNGCLPYLELSMNIVPPQL